MPSYTIYLFVTVIISLLCELPIVHRAYVVGLLPLSQSQPTVRSLSSLHAVAGNTPLLFLALFGGSLPAQVYLIKPAMPSAFLLNHACACQARPSYRVAALSLRRDAPPLIRFGIDKSISY